MTIIRILEGNQWEVDEAMLEELNRIDAKLVAAMDAGDEELFHEHLTALNEAVTSRGNDLGHDSFLPHDAAIPPADYTIADARKYLHHDGLIPGEPAAAVEN